MSAGAVNTGEVYPSPDEARMLERMEDRRVRALAVSHVQFHTGYRVDVARLSAAARASGTWLVFDSIQALGHLPFDVRETPVDILACGAQKWLCSPWGTGFAYVRPDLVGRLEPAEIGWMAQPASENFGSLMAYDATWHADARRFEVVTLDFVSFRAMAESIGLQLELGAADIAAHVRALGDRAVAFAAGTAGVTLITPSEPTRRAGLFAFRTRDCAATSDRLRAARVAHSVREGCVRFSPHFYTTPDEFDHAMSLLAP